MLINSWIVTMWKTMFRLIIVHQTRRNITVVVVVKQIKNSRKKYATVCYLRSANIGRMIHNIYYHSLLAWQPKQKCVYCSQWTQCTCTLSRCNVWIKWKICHGIRLDLSEHISMQTNLDVIYKCHGKENGKIHFQDKIRHSETSIYEISFFLHYNDL